MLPRVAGVASGSGRLRSPAATANIAAIKHVNSAFFAGSVKADKGIVVCH